MRYYTTREACEILSVHVNTLRKWESEGKINCVRTQGGHRRYDLSSYLPKISKKKTLVCYCRVSSAKQKDELNRQVKFMKDRFPEGEVIKEIGSGINFNRHGLKAILERSMSGEQLQVVVAYKDRLARFGADLVSWVIEQNGGEVVSLNEPSHSPDAEVKQDLFNILYAFSYRMRWLKKYRDKIKEEQGLP
ncbi:MAG: IS607 family transposase [Clostridiales bacterium]|jgi:excisionase family DNA binding protein|nr:IS607 family transposase [Clostridiales bacterium]